MENQIFRHIRALPGHIKKVRLNYWIFISGIFHLFIIIIILSSVSTHYTRGISPAISFIQARLAFQGQPESQTKQSQQLRKKSNMNHIPGNVPKPDKEYSNDEKPPSLSIQEGNQPDPITDQPYGEETTGIKKRSYKDAAPLEPFTPLYPVYSNLHKQEGDVTLHYKIDTMGIPFDIQVIQSSGYKALDRSAVEYIRNHRFLPASLDGTPVISEREDTFAFIRPKS